MKSLKKILALALVAMMVLAMGATAFAFDSSDSTEDKPAIVSDTDIASTTFKVIFDPEAELTTPGVTFSYTIGNGAAVADSTPIVYAGVTGGLTLAANSTAFTVAEGTTAGAGNAVTHTLTLNFDETKFDHAGVYRYTLTQSKFSKEIVEAGILNEGKHGGALTKYVDVYVGKDASTTPATMMVLGAVMFNRITTLSVGDDGKVEYTSKTDNFTNTFGTKAPDGTDPYPEDPDDPNDPDPSKDGKHTITLSKNIAGNFADDTELFPFTITVSYTGTDVTLTGTEYAIAVTGGSLKSSSDTKYLIGNTYEGEIKLKGGDSATITVPNNVDVVIKETTAATEGYVITNSQTNLVQTTPQSDNMLTVRENDTTGVKAYEDANGVAGKVYENDATVGYLNERSSISPTGVIMRIAPFASMFAAGIILIAIVRRRKDEVEA